MSVSKLYLDKFANKIGSTFFFSRSEKDLDLLNRNPTYFFHSLTYWNKRDFKSDGTKDREKTKKTPPYYT